jgi:hypothetical protein
MSRTPKFVPCTNKARYSTAGGAAYEDFLCAGVLAASAIACTMNKRGATPVTIESADYQTTDTIRVYFSADPSNDHELTLCWR